MTSTTARVIAALAVPIAAVSLSACGGSSTDHAGHSGSSTTAEAGQPANHNADDVAFARNMITHHEQAIEMSTLVPTHTPNPDIIALAQQITKAQRPEIQAFTAFLLQWDEDPHETGHPTLGAMSGMVDQATMDKLKSLNGPEFDTLWLQSMMAHHRGAIEMAQAEVTNGQNQDAITMAQSIVTSQQAEIDRMRQLLGG